MTKDASGLSPASSASRETPSQVVPGFDHRVTQCRSTVGVSVGNSRNDFQSHRRSSALFSFRIVNSQRSSGMRGVGPADKTGKSVVRYCPGGSFTLSAVLRPEKPREMMLTFISSLPDEFCEEARFSTQFGRLKSATLHDMPVRPFQ